MHYYFKKMIFGTHNSGTGEKLVWWQRPFSFFLHLTSRCQSRTIDEQLKHGVKLFNFQITYYKNEWRFSHGLCIYEGNVEDVLKKMKKYTKTDRPIYYQLHLDKNFLLGQNVEEFKKLVDKLKKQVGAQMLYAFIEGTNEYIYDSGIELDVSENYWSSYWGKYHGKSIIDKIPLPKRHAKKYNKKYKAENKFEYLMLDFYEI